MPLVSDEAVVLKRLDYSETSQVLVLFTRLHGKARAIAKGIKRSTRTRYAAAIDLLDVGTVSLSHRAGRGDALATLTEWKQVRYFAGLRQSLPGMYAAQYAAEVTAGMTEDWDAHPGLYDSLVDLLGQLADVERPLPALVAFISRLLTEAGLAPQFERCVGCSRPIGNHAPEGTLFFSSFEGGPLCRDCEPAHIEKRQLRTEVLRWLRGHDAAPPEACTAALDLLNYHLSHVMGRRPLLADKLLPRPN